MNNRTRLVAALAAISFTAVSIPAFAQGIDPDGSASSAKPSADQQKLTDHEKRVKICRPETNSPHAKTVCMTRGQWIREGLDPVTAR